MTQTNVDYVFEKNARDKAKHFGIGAQLELDFLGGLINIKGSAQFLKDDRRSNNVARVVMAGNMVGSVEEINKYTPLDYPQVCDMVRPTTGPTHIVTRVTKGQRSYFVFDKFVSQFRDSEDISGKLEASVKAIPLFTIKGTVAFHANGTIVSNIDRLNVKFYGDALLASFPTQYPQAAVAYDETIKKGARTTPVKFDLVPVSEFCKQSTSDAVVVRITDDLVESASSSLSTLKDILAEVNTLLELDPAIRYEAIKRQLNNFKAEIEKFVFEYSASLAALLPKLKAKEVEEIELTKLIQTYTDSAFQKSRAEKFLTLRKKEIDTITQIIDKALKDPYMSLSDVSNAKDNECIFKGKYGSSFVLKLLPSGDIAQEFLDSRGPWNERDTWYMNNWRKIKEIGNEKQIFEDFVAVNKKEPGKSQCFLMKLEEMLDVNDPYEISLYEEGRQFEKHFVAPLGPPTPRCPAEFLGSSSLHLTSRKKVNKQITGHEVLIERLSEHGEFIPYSVVVPNEDTLVVNGLTPFTQYRFRTRYVIHSRHSYSETTDYVDDCITKPTSPPAALTVTETTATSLALSWARPEEMHSAFRNSAIKYRVSVSDRGSVVETQDLSYTITGLQPSTLYTVHITAEVLDSKVDRVQSLRATAEFVTAPAAPAAPVAGQVQDNRARFTVKVGDVTVPAGVSKELLSIKYYKIQNNLPVSGSTVYYMQRLQGQGNTEIDIASFETGAQYGVQVKLLVKQGDKMFGSEYSDKTVITTTTEGSPIDNLRDNINTFEASSKQDLDSAAAQRDSLTATLTAAESRFNAAKSGGLQKITDLGADISNNFAGIQKKSNALQKSKCVVDGYWFWSHSQNRLGTATAKSLADCLAKCADTDRCSSSSYKVTTSGVSSGSCEMFSKRLGDMLFSQTNYFSANLYCQISDAATLDTWRECVQQGTGYTGSDIASTGGISTVEECVSFCQTVDNCQSVTYTKSTKQCNAKSKRKGDSVISSGDKVSVTMPCLSANRGGVSRCTKDSVRFTGSVIQTTKQDSLDLCIQHCSYKDSCESVSYRASDKTCVAHNKRLGASRRTESGWTSLNLYCLGLQYF